MEIFFTLTNISMFKIGHNSVKFEIRAMGIVCTHEGFDTG